MFSQKPIDFQKQKKPLVTKTFIIVFSLMFILPIGFYGTFIGQCKFRQLSVRHSKQSEISTFEQVKITSTDNSSAKVYLGGDCLDSNPYVQVDKKVPSSSSAPELLADMRMSLKSQGYTLSNEKVYNGNCGYTYSSDATGNGINFSISFAAYVSNPSSDFLCHSGHEADENVLVGKPAENLYARLKT